MSQFTRKKLSRGVKLLVEHVFDPLSSVATTLSNAGIQTQSIRDDDTSFRVSFLVPQLSGYQMFQWNTAGSYSDADGTRPWCFPFAIPQPQEVFNQEAVIDQNTVQFTLDEVSVAWDSRGENAAILDFGNAAVGYNEGGLEHNGAQRLDLQLAIVEKTMLSQNSNAGFDPDREIFNGRLAPSAFSGRYLRLNPFVFSDLNKQMHPYKTYMLCVNCEGLRPDTLPTDTTNWYLSLPAFTVSLKFKSKRVRRDRTADNVQNLPAHGGANTTSPFTINTPNADDLVTADGTDGIDNEASLFDLRLMRRLWSGYTKQGDVSGIDHFTQDSGLEVIAVPLWSNFSERGRLNSTTVEDAVHVGATPFDGPICDERWIRIGYPFTIHHCLLALNYGSGRGGGGGWPLTAGVKPSSATFSGEVGVALFTGIKAAHMAYQQVAYLNYDPTTLPNYVIDRIRHNQRQTLTNFDHVFDLVQIPLVQDGATTGTGYKNLAGAAITQGAPIFVGKGASSRTTEGRSTIGDGVGGSQNPLTAGCEQYLVVRQAFEDPNGLGAAGAAAGDNDVYAGVGGNWLYLIGKKTVVGGREPVMSAGR